MKQEGLIRELRAKGLSVTKPRISVATLVRVSKTPLTPQEIAEQLGAVCDQATVYRTIRSLDKVGLIRQVDLRHNHAHYEWSHGADCHHVICSICGMVEHLEKCDIDHVGGTVLKSSRLFSKIQEHSLTFYGLCKKCDTSRK